MGPQKSRELYRLGAGGSNQLGFAQKGDETAQIAVVLTLSVAAVFAGVSFVMQQAVNADLRSTLGSASWPCATPCRPPIWLSAPIRFADCGPLWNLWSGPTSGERPEAAAPVGPILR
jgi:hypothetical protein